MGCCCSTSSSPDDLTSKSSLKKALLSDSSFTSTSLALSIHLTGAGGLPATGIFRSDCDPYVKFTLNGVTKRSSYKSATTDPTWAPAEIFRFLPLEPGELTGGMLLVTVIDKDFWKRNDLIGDGRIDLKDIDITSTEPVRKKIKLYKLNGDLIVSVFLGGGCVTFLIILTNP